ncbi:MAG: DUF1015 domain-containing protein [Dehalococcoidia bacterium]
MTDVRPFRGLRYDPDVVRDWGAVLGPPYDIIGPKERAALVMQSPYQITQVEAPLGRDGVAAAATKLRQWRHEGALRQDFAPGFYVAEHQFSHAGRECSRTSIYAIVQLTPWAEGAVLPHEWTMPGPKAERASLREAVRADISPVMSLVRDRQGKIVEVLEAARTMEPVAEGSDANGDRHSLRIINHPMFVSALVKAFQEEILYIADGHHRYESALEYRDRLAAAAGQSWSGAEPENFILMGLVRAEDAGLIVGATHRMIQVAPPTDAIERIGATFAVKEIGSISDGLDALTHQVEAAGTSAPAMVVLGLRGATIHLLRADARTATALPAEVPSSWSALEAALLQYLILGPVFGIDDAALRAGDAVTYSHDAGAVFEAVSGGRVQAGFILTPPTLAQLYAAAEGGERMPQKSTYFTPKLPTGLVLHAFDPT